MVHDESEGLSSSREADPEIGQSSLLATHPPFEIRNLTL